MPSTHHSCAWLRDGLARRRAQVEAQIRSAPGDADLRARLFQLASVDGDWARAAEQLRLCAQLNPRARPMAVLYEQAIAAERVREAVLAGREEPGFLGARPQWCERLLQALRLDEADPERAAQLREQALQDAPALGGTLTAAHGAGDGGEDGKAYAWICDGDSRLGPVCEWLSGGGYAWLPLQEVRQIALLAPEGLCDLLWVRAQATLADGRVVHGLVPARYPAPPGASLAEQGEALRLGRETRWRPLAGQSYAGAGQKMWMTDAGEFALLDVRRLVQEQPA